MFGQTPREIEVSDELARALDFGPGGGSHDYFALLGLSPKQASPEDAATAAEELALELREVLYDRQVGREARDLAKTLKAVAEALSTARDIADYRREIEAAPRRGQMALLREFEREARDILAGSPDPPPALLDELRKRAERMKLQETVAETLLQRLWAEFAPLPVDPAEAALRPGPVMVEDVALDETPVPPPKAFSAESAGGRQPKKPLGLADLVLGGNAISKPASPFPASDAAVDLEALGRVPLGEAAARPREEKVGPRKRITGAVDLGDLNLDSQTDPGFLGPSAREIEDVPLEPEPTAAEARQGPRFADPSRPTASGAFVALGESSSEETTTLSDESDSSPEISIPRLPTESSPGGWSPSAKPAGRPVFGTAPTAQMAASDSPPGPGWAAAADDARAWGAASVALRDIEEAPAWPGLFPAYGKTLAATRARLEQARLVGAAAPGNPPRRVSSPEMPRLVSNRPKKPEPPAPEPAPSLPEGYGDFQKPFSGNLETWRRVAETPSYDKEIADAEAAFLDRALGLADPKGKLSAKKIDLLLGEANSYGLTMAQAMRLVQERFKGAFPKTARPRKKAQAGPEGPDPSPPRGSDPAAEPFVQTTADQPPAWKLAAKALARQLPELLFRFLNWWPALLLGGALLGFLGLNFLWKQVEDNGGKAIYLQPLGVPTPAPAPEPVPPAPGEINYLASTLRLQATPKPDGMTEIPARFLEGGAYVASFSARLCEVTVAEYADFVAATGRTVPADWTGGKPPAGSMTFPVTNVSYADAAEFCRWKTRRDRLEGEEYALPSARHYKALVRMSNAVQRAGATVGQPMPWPASSPGNDALLSKEGRQILHLFGNVAEWVWDEETQRPAVVGGAWTDPDAGFASAMRAPGREVPWSAVGFRYVRAPKSQISRPESGTAP